MFAQIQAVTFDCYGTLVDWDTGVAAFLRGWLERAGLALEAGDLLGRFADAQRRHQAATPFKSYRRVLRHAFAEVAQGLGVVPHEADLEAFPGSVGTWPPFADTTSTLHRLKSAGFLLGVISNVDDASFTETHRQLDGLIDEVVTADAVRAYKPAEPHFHAMIERLARHGIARGEILHVAQSRFHDIAPARRLGLATVWVDRRADRPGRGITIAADASPDLRVENLSALLDALAVPPAAVQD